MPEEKTARLILNRFGERPPVNVRRIADEYATIKELPFPVGCDAVTIREPGDRDRPRILINSNSTNFEPRKRFTLSHEIGHIKIPWHYGSIAYHIDEGTASVSGNHYSYEVEAHRFASELLMPTDWVRRIIDDEMTIEKIFNRIVNDAEVSRTAARIKLMKNLPPGFVCAVYSPATGNFERIEESSNGCLSLFIEPGDRTTLTRLTKALEFHAVDRAVFVYGGNVVQWWRLDSYCEVPAIQETRSSSEILRGITEDLLETRDLQNKAIAIINGYASDGYQKSPIQTRIAFSGR